MPNEDSAPLVSLEVVKGLLAVPESAFRTMVEVMFNGIKDDLKKLRKDVSDLKVSLEFSQKDVSEIEKKLTVVSEKIASHEGNIVQHSDTIVGIDNKVEYIENQSRRNSIKLLGLAEAEDEKSWDDSEKVFIECLKTKLEFNEPVEIERAHRTGIKHAPGATREDGSAFGPRPLVAKFKSWKQKEAVLRIARNKKPDGLYLHPDLAERTLQRRRSQVPEMLRARKEGKTAYFIRDKLVISDKQLFHPPNRRRPRSSFQTTHFGPEDVEDETEVSFG
eukprot:Seg3040.4 transcript_id=Seg3040.4/GoldUCD/mRNA.D3Y31 product="hypothetical protein" protein_id=Seg3040.4/GoldUCD/D3Y31